MNMYIALFKNSYTLLCVLCIAALAMALYAYIDKRNRVVELQMHIPELTKQVQALYEENTRLRFEIEQFESPSHLMELARAPRFSHLKHPFIREVLTLQTKEPVSSYQEGLDEKTRPVATWLLAGIGW